jgi:sulfite reductase (ferredoxin)
MSHHPSVAGDPAEQRHEIDAFSGSLRRWQRGRVPDAVFLEHRLRHGVYGQRQDGVHMMRSKLPLGLISAAQLRAMADVTEHFGGGVAHLTTRQDIQVHFVALQNTPDFMRGLADANATTREACGNVVRNVTASPVSGAWPDEAFDITPYGMALTRFLLRHPDGQDLGRKFKIHLSNTEDPQFNLAAIHDLGAVARLRNGVRGFRLLVGGGLGAVPHQAQELADFVPVSELLPTALALLQVFAELGERRNRARARLKFVVSRMGIEAFRAVVAERRVGLADDPAWRCFELDVWTDVVGAPGPAELPERVGPVQAAWLRTNLLATATPGLVTVKLKVPSGDLSPQQLRGLARLVDRFGTDHARIGVDQSLFLRWVRTDELLSLHAELDGLGLAAPRAGGLGDTVTCPGADTCKLGITSPRSVARELAPLLVAMAAHPRLQRIRIHVSGCPNSCAQHQVADIGLFGAARTKGGVVAPSFVLMLGGYAGGLGPGERPGDGFAVPVGKLPARRVPAAVRSLLDFYLKEGGADASFSAFTRRVGRAVLKQRLAPLTALPAAEDAPELYREFGKESEPFAVRRGVGECAGEVVELADMLLAEADRLAEQALDRLDAGGEARPAAEQAMVTAARALLSVSGKVAPTDPISAFKNDFYDSGLIFEGVGHYLLATTTLPDVLDADRLRRLVVEAGLFVEEAHTLLSRLRNPLSNPQAAK